MSTTEPPANTFYEAPNAMQIPSRSEKMGIGMGLRSRRKRSRN